MSAHFQWDFPSGKCWACLLKNEPRDKCEFQVLLRWQRNLGLRQLRAKAELKYCRNSSLFSEDINIKRWKKRFYWVKSFPFKWRLGRIGSQYYEYSIKSVGERTSPWRDLFFASINDFSFWKIYMNGYWELFIHKPISIWSQIWLLIKDSSFMLSKNSQNRILLNKGKQWVYRGHNHHYLPQVHKKNSILARNHRSWDTYLLPFCCCAFSGPIWYEILVW